MKGRSERDKLNLKSDTWAKNEGSKGCCSKQKLLGEDFWEIPYKVGEVHESPS